MIYLLFLQMRAKRAERIIKKKQKCLTDENMIGECNCDDKEKVQGELEELSEDLEELREILKRELERVRIIEDKAKSLLIVLSLLGVIYSFLYEIVKTIENPLFLGILILLVLVELVCLVSSIFSLLYILLNANVVYEPYSSNTGNLKTTILLNRYQNLIRTNYLSVVYSNIKLFFGVMFFSFCTYFLYLLCCTLLH